MIGYIKNREVIVFFWKERYHGSLDQNDREHDIELLITNIDGSINNIAVIVLISHCLETNSTRTYQSTIHNFHFQNPTAAYIQIIINSIIQKATKKKCLKTKVLTMGRQIWPSQYQETVEWILGLPAWSEASFVQN